MQMLRLRQPETIVFSILGCLFLFVLRVISVQKPFIPPYSSLRHYPVYKHTVSVSGLSNGAGFALHMSFIYSSLIRGCGVFAGAPYPAAGMVYEKQATYIFKAEKYYPIIDKYSALGAIDPVQNMKGFRAFVWQGKNDILVPKYFNFAVVAQLKHYGAIVKAELQTVRAGHCFPTNTFAAYLPQLGSLQATCNPGYQGVNHMFHHFFGSRFIWPHDNKATPTGLLFKYDQNEFFADDYAEGGGFNNAAFIYVPKLCAWHKAKCHLHLAFHGSSQPLMARIVGDGFSEFVQSSGYMQVADANNIIVLFPEVKPANIPSFDIWGITGKDFAFKNGTQPLAIAKMIRRVVYGV